MLAALIVVGGSLGDKKGRVRIFMLGILIFTLGSAACGFAQSINQLIAFRAIQGVGGAFMIPGSLSIISAVFIVEEKGKAIGTWSAATTIVTVCGPVLGGALADIGLWRFIFFINIPLGVLAWLLLAFKVPESSEKGASSVDWLGSGLLVASLFALTYGFLEMPEIGYLHPIVIASLVVGVILMGAFVLVEGRVKHPMLPFSLFESRTFSGVNLLSFFLYAALGGIMLFLSLNVIQIQGYTQLQAGLTFLPFSVMMIFMARKMGSLADKFGPRRFLIVGPLLTSLGIFLLSTVGMTAGPQDYWTTYFPYFLLFAFGMSMTVVPLTTAVMTSVSENKAGIASGVNNSVTRIAGTFMNAVLGAVAIYLFVTYVTEGMDTLVLTTAEQERVVLEAEQLGEAQAPQQLAVEKKVLVNNLYDEAFIQTYRWVGRFSAVLALIAAGIAFFYVRDEDCQKKS